MKNLLIRIIEPTFMLVVCLLILFKLSCCNRPDPETTLQVRTKLLTASTWKIEEVNVDGVDQTSLFQNLTLRFTATGFNSSNGEPVWPTSGTWTFGDSEGVLIQRSDGIEMHIEALDDRTLVLSFMWPTTTLGGGRANSIAGSHRFRFVTG